MRQAIHLLVFGLLFFTVRSCGVNETYDRMKYGAESVGETIGVPAAGRAWNERIYPAVVGTASRSIQQGSVATFNKADRVVAGSESGGMRGSIHKGIESIKRGFRELIGGPAQAPAQPAASGAAPP